MSRNLRTAFILVFCLACATASAHADDIEQHLRKNFEGKIVALRAGYDGEKIRFANDGTLIGKPANRPWLNGGIVLVKKVELKADLLAMDGDRVVFMHKTENPIATSKRLRVEIQLGPSPTDDSVARALSAVFEGDMKGRLANFHLEAGRVGTATPWDTRGDKLVYNGNSARGAVSPPTPLETPDPDYSDRARKKKINGAVMIRFVVDENGFPELFDVQKSIPELDVNAVEAVSRWRFEPAKQGGTPVPVNISVEVNFHSFR